MCSSSPKKQRFFVTLSTADLLNPRLRSTASSGTWATDRLRNLFSNLRESHVRADNFKACENEMAHSHLERKGCRILIFFNNTLSHSRSVQSGSPGLRSPTGPSVPKVQQRDLRWSLGEHRVWGPRHPFALDSLELRRAPSNDHRLGSPDPAGVFWGWEVLWIAGLGWHRLGT